jgi:hypothetical protein
MLSSAAMDDRAMIFLVREVLDHPDEYTLSPQMRELLSRLHELLEREAAKRPKHRPRADETGALVASLHESGRPLAKAKSIIAKATKKKPRTVARAYERYMTRNERRQK